MASSQGFPEVARLLLEKGADVNKARNNGVTPLGKASSQGFLEVARLLLGHHADANEAKMQTPMAAWGGTSPSFGCCSRAGRISP